MAAECRSSREERRARGRVADRASMRPCSSLLNLNNLGTFRAAVSGPVSDASFGAFVVIRHTMHHSRTFSGRIVPLKEKLRSRSAESSGAAARDPRLGCSVPAAEESPSRVQWTSDDCAVSVAEDRTASSSRSQSQSWFQLGVGRGTIIPTLSLRLRAGGAAPLTPATAPA